jgi:ATP-binding cassette subfamily C (CFTR/MRP) protein 1
MDDCLSAVDAHTSQALINDCFLSGPMAGKTRILITHALHVLDKADYIYVIDKGRIAEEGTYLVRCIT